MFLKSMCRTIIRQISTGRIDQSVNYLSLIYVYVLVQDLDTNICRFLIRNGTYLEMESNLYLHKIGNKL